MKQLIYILNVFHFFLFRNIEHIQRRIIHSKKNNNFILLLHGRCNYFHSFFTINIITWNNSYIFLFFFSETSHTHLKKKKKKNIYIYIIRLYTIVIFIKFYNWYFCHSRNRYLQSILLRNWYFHAIDTFTQSILSHNRYFHTIAFY